MNAPLPERLVLYDGVCGLCHRTVRFLLRVDRDSAFTYAPLQGEAAARARALYPNIPDELSTFVFIEGGRAHLRSRAFAHAARHLPYPWRLGALSRFVPAFLADLAYRLVAKVRYRLFGQHDTCSLPSPEQRARFLP